MSIATAQESTSARLSDEVIPSVRGEFYSYRATFTKDRPLYALMKCKANKDRPKEFAEHYLYEVDLVFTFDCGVWAYAPGTSTALRVLGNYVGRRSPNQSWIMPVSMNKEDFYRLSQQKDGEALAKICRDAIENSANSVVRLFVGRIFALTTGTGKYGLFRVTNLTATSVTVDACHILL